MQITIEIDDKYVLDLKEEISVQHTLANAGGIIDDYVEYFQIVESLGSARQIRRDLITLAPVLDALYRAAREAAFKRE